MGVNISTPFGAVGSGGGAWESGSYTFSSAVADQDGSHVGQVETLATNRILFNSVNTSASADAYSLSFVGNVETRNGNTLYNSNAGGNEANVRLCRLTDTLGVVGHREFSSSNRTNLRVIEINDGTEAVETVGNEYFTTTADTYEIQELDSTKFAFAHKEFPTFRLRRMTVSGTTISADGQVSYPTSGTAPDQYFTSFGLFTVDSNHVGIIGRAVDSGFNDFFDVGVWDLTTSTITKNFRTRIGTWGSSFPGTINDVRVVKLAQDGNDGIYIAYFDMNFPTNKYAVMFRINTSTYSLTTMGTPTDTGVPTSGSGGRSDIIRLTDTKAAVVVRNVFYVLDCPNDTLVPTINNMATIPGVANSGDSNRIAPIDFGGDPTRVYVGTVQNGVVVTTS